MSAELANRISFAERRLAVRAAELVYERLPELDRRYGPQARSRCEEDTALHLRFIASAVAADEARIVADYLAWLEPLLRRFDVPAGDLTANLDAIEQAVGELVPDAAPTVSALLAEVRAGR